MNPRSITAIARRIAYQFRRDPRSLALLIVVPIVILTILWWIFDTEPQPTEVAVVTTGETAEAAQIVEQLNSSDSLDAFTTDLQDAMEQLESQDIDGVLELPEGFTEENIGSTAVTLTVDGSESSQARTTIRQVTSALTNIALQAMGIDGQPVTVNVDYLHGGEDASEFDSFAPVLIAFFTFFFILFSLILAESQYPDVYPEWTLAEYWAVAIISVLLLFASVLVHEFAHAFVAQARGIGVNSITLFIFGGVASLSQDSEEASDEFLIAIAGPIASVALAVVFGLAYLAVGDTNDQARAVLGYLALINVILAVFNMIPGYPLDGGRVFRSIIWGITGNVRRATQIAAAVGIGIGILFVVLGILSLIAGNVVNGIWLIVIGWFLQNAAQQSQAAVEQEQTLLGITVSDLMNAAPLTIEPQVDLATMAEEYVLRRNARGMPVVQDGQLLGIITVTNLREIPRERWASTTVREAMTPASQLSTITPDADVSAALEIMTQHDFHQIPVVDHDRLVGLLTRFELVRYMRIRQELGANA